MTATVRLDKKLESTLIELSETLHKRKSDIIREAIGLYADAIKKEKSSKLAKAVKKTKDIDLDIYKSYEGILSDAL